MKKTIKTIKNFIYRFKRAWCLAKKIRIIKNLDTDDEEIWYLMERNEKTRTETLTRIA